MADELTDWARLAAEAFMAASRAADPQEAELHRRRAYRIVDHIRGRELGEPPQASTREGRQDDNLT